MNRRVREIQAALQLDLDDFVGPPMVRLQRSLMQQRLFCQDLEKQLHVWKNIVQMAPIGYLEVNRFDELQWINPKAQALLHADPSDKLQISNRLLLQVVRSLELEQLIRQVRQVRQAQVLDWTLHRVDAENPTVAAIVQLRGYGIPLPQDHVGVFIEDRREAILLTTERDRWASDVAHELKTPLTSIQLMLETLQDQINPELRIWTERLLNEAERLSTLVHDLLELSQMALKPAALRLGVVDLPALLRTAWLNLEPLAQQKDLALLYNGPDQLELRADEARLYRVLANLIDNAIKHSPQSAALMVRLGTVPPPHGFPATTARPQRLPPDGANWIAIDVIDAGSGFPPGTLEHIFKRFYRADPARARSSLPLPSSDALPASSPTDEASAIGSGSGLGLAIVHQIVMLHGGQVQAQNHPETGGAWLRVLLPKQQQSHASTP